MNEWMNEWMNENRMNQKQRPAHAYFEFKKNRDGRLVAASLELKFYVSIARDKVYFNNVFVHENNIVSRINIRRESLYRLYQ